MDRLSDFIELTFESAGYKFSFLLVKYFQAAVSRSKRIDLHRDLVNVVVGLLERRIIHKFGFETIFIDVGVDVLLFDNVLVFVALIFLVVFLFFGRLDKCRSLIHFCLLLGEQVVVDPINHFIPIFGFLSESYL